MPLPATAEQWRAAAARDIEAGYRVTQANHAGVLDPHNPAFVSNLAAARDYGLALAARTVSAAGYAAALQGFTARIHDGHAGMRTRFDASAFTPPQWPGFVAAWRDGLVVYASEGDAAHIGERIVSCDGIPANQLMEQNVFAFAGRSDEGGQWWSEAPKLFIDTGNPFVTRPGRCLFEADGKRSERTLAWRPGTAQARAWQENTMSGEALPVGLTEPQKNVFWMAMPTFKPLEAERATYRAVSRQIETERQRFLQADAIVIDLRRNGGGNSMWSRDFASALWGAERVRRRSEAATANEQAWYRATPGNIAHYRKALDLFTAQQETAMAGLVGAIEAGMLRAQAAGQPYYIHSGQTPTPSSRGAADLPGDPPALTRPVYVIVPGNCASACLDAVDVFKLFSNTKLIGAPSSADSTYMDVRSEDLPGGLARVLVPTKLYVNRPRGSGAFYPVDITVTSIDWGTAAFLDVVRRDLASR